MFCFAFYKSFVVVVCMGYVFCKMHPFQDQGSSVEENARNTFSYACTRCLHKYVWGFKNIKEIAEENHFTFLQ